MGPKLTHRCSHSSGLSRRQVLTSSISVLVLTTTPVRCPPPSHGAQQAPVDRTVMKAFEDALRATGSEAQDVAWTHVIELAPNNSAAWSNRGALRLQNMRWAAAESDLRHAVELESGPSGSPSVLDDVDASTLNNLGNAEVALGRLEEAQLHFRAAARDPALQSLALANAALAAFQDQQDALAVRVARQVVRRDPEFLDMRAGLVAMLYGSGRVAEAEEEWDTLQEAQDGLGAALYNKRVALDRIKGRWPPRATAALAAFLSLSDTGTAIGYGIQAETYTFPLSGIPPAKGPPTEP
ncbi:hypothetical protein V8C86DRAFT_66524 [Haematococcus lacustris]